jgi:hypothetical protein
VHSIKAPEHVQRGLGQSERVSPIGGSNATVSEPDRIAIIVNSVFTKVCKILLLCLMLELLISLNLVICYSVEAPLQ